MRVGAGTGGGASSSRVQPGTVDRRLALRAAMLYYLDDLTQAQVAARLGVSRPTVGRLVARARAEGLVRIEVGTPDGSRQAEHALTEADLERAFGLREAVVVDDAGSDAGRHGALGRAAAALLVRRLLPADRLGLAWGRTMAALAEALPVGAARCAEVVQLDGSTASAAYRSRGEYILTHAAERLGATPYPLAAPLYADAATVRSLETDSAIAPVLERGRACDVVMFSVGDMSIGSTLLAGSFIGPDVLETLLAAGAVGDACGRHFDAAGHDVATDLVGRTLAVGLDALRACPTSVLVAAGDRKHDAVLGALLGGLADVLVTDESTASRLLAVRGPADAPEPDPIPEDAS